MAVAPHQGPASRIGPLSHAPNTRTGRSRARLGENERVDVRVGLCGWTVSQASYVRRFPLVEVQHTFYDPPADAVLTRWRWWTAVPFTAGFWSFSFPLATLTASALEAVRRGGWPREAALAAVLVASAVIAFLAVRTIVLLAQGRLLPPR